MHETEPNIRQMDEEEEPLSVAKESDHYVDGSTHLQICVTQRHYCMPGNTTEVRMAFGS